VGVLKQGVKFLPTELRCGGSAVSVIQSDKVELTRNKVRNAGRVPVAVELRSEGVLKFVGVEGQGCEPVEVLLVTIGRKRGSGSTSTSKSMAYARLPRELTRPMSFGFRSGTRPTPPACGHQLTGNKIRGPVGLAASLEADVIVVVGDWGCGNGWWQNVPLAPGPQRVT
jgi:hypothetical protein